MELLLAQDARTEKISLRKGGSFTTSISSKNTRKPIISPQNLRVKVLPFLDEILPNVRNHTRILLTPLHLRGTKLLTAAAFRQILVLDYRNRVRRRFRRNRQNHTTVKKVILMWSAIVFHGRKNAEPNDAVRPLEMRRRVAGVGSFPGVGEREKGEVYR